MSCNGVTILTCRERANSFEFFPFTSSESLIPMENTRGLSFLKKVPTALLLQTSSFLVYLLLVFVNTHIFSSRLCNQCVPIGNQSHTQFEG